MYEIFYLSNDDRKRWTDLTDTVRNAANDEDRSKAYQELAQIEARRKYLGACTADECMALKEQFYDKYRKLNAIGRSTQARQFHLMLQAVDLRIRAIRFEEVKKDRVQKAEALAQQEKAVEKSATNTKPGASKNKWAIRIDDDSES